MPLTKSSPYDSIGSGTKSYSFTRPKKSSFMAPEPSHNHNHNQAPSATRSSIMSSGETNTTGSLAGGTPPYASASTTAPNTPSRPGRAGGGAGEGSAYRGGRGFGAFSVDDIVSRLPPISSSDVGISASDLKAGGGLGSPSYHHKRSSSGLIPAGILHSRQGSNTGLIPIGISGGGGHNYHHHSSTTNSHKDKDREQQLQSAVDNSSGLGSNAGGGGNGMAGGGVNPHGFNTQYLSVSCTRLYFPRLDETVQLAPPAAAGGGGNPLDFTSPTISTGSLCSNLQQQQRTMPPSFTAYDVENVIHLRSTLGTNGGLVSSSISANATTASISTAMGVTATRPTASSHNTLLCGHPLVLYKVKSSAASVFSCSPSYGMLQRYVGDTVNVLSPCDGLSGAGTFAGTLAAVERASERLFVGIRNPHGDGDAEGGAGSRSNSRSRSVSPSASGVMGGSGRRSSSAFSRAPSATMRTRRRAVPTATRDIEKLRIEFVVVLDTPTQQEVKNVIRTSALGIMDDYSKAKGLALRRRKGHCGPNNGSAFANAVPPAYEEGGSAASSNTSSGTFGGGDLNSPSSPAINMSPQLLLKSLQPVMAKLFDELTEKVPEGQRGEHVDSAAAGEPSGGEEGGEGGAPRRPSPAPRRSASAPRRRKPSALVGSGPLLTFGVGITEEPSDPAIVCGHTDLSCYMGCGAELAEFIPSSSAAGRKRVSHNNRKNIASPVFASANSLFPTADQLTDLEYEKRYVRKAAVADGAAADDGVTATALSTLVHPLPIPSTATIQLKAKTPSPSRVQSPREPLSLMKDRSAPSSPAVVTSYGGLSVLGAPQAGGMVMGGTSAKQAKKQKGGVPAVVALLAIILMYAFVYCWRHIDY